MHMSRAKITDSKDAKTARVMRGPVGVASFDVLLCTVRIPVHALSNPYKHSLADPKPSIPVRPMFNPLRCRVLERLLRH